MENHSDGTAPHHGMKAKTIRMVLRKKTDAWLATIKDEDLRKAARKDMIVTGGCIASMLLGEKVNDFDIYFRTKDTVLSLADYYVREFNEHHKAKAAEGSVPVSCYVEDVTDLQGRPRVRVVVKSAGVASAASSDDEDGYQYFEGAPDEDSANSYLSEVFDRAETDAAKGAGVADRDVDGEPYTPAFLSSNAISLRGKVQLILRFYGSPDEIHENYDFVHVTNYWEGATGKLVLRPEALEALLSKTLVYRGSLYPISSVIRTRKFVERGWRINAGQYLKMMIQIADLDMRDFKVLEEQLTGVDVAYFAEVLAKVHAKSPEKIDTAYLVEVIDRMF